MGMTREDYEKQINSSGRVWSDPLWVQGYFALDGHSENTVNATATFIKFGDRHYACTCRHVTEALEAEGAEQLANLALMVDRSILNLSQFRQDGLVSTFRAPAGTFADLPIDIAIAQIDSYWKILERDKDKVAIDFDAWSPPPWERIKFGAAMGYATEHKERDGCTVKTPMPCVTAELQSTLNAETREFTLHRTLDVPHGKYFSGMSGGPIVGCWDEEFAPIGLVFEGLPSSREQSAQDSLYGPCDIFIRGLVLTPERFARWLAQIPRE